MGAALLGRVQPTRTPARHNQLGMVREPSTLDTRGMVLDTSGWPGQPNLLDTWNEVRRLDLIENVAELATFGLTVVPPEKTGTPQLAPLVLDRCLDLIERRTGTRPDLESGETHRDIFYPSLHWVLFEDRVFEEFVVHPVTLALASYLLGRSLVYGGSELFAKGPSSRPDEPMQLGLHSDQVLMPSPLPAQAMTINVTWTLTDYTKDDGCLAFLPGSHAYRRHPIGDEGMDKAVPVETPAGSIIVWHGNTWHGSYPKKTPGLRIGLASLYSRKFLITPEPIRSHVSQEMLDRHDARFAEVMGVDMPYGWKDEGPDMAKLGRATVRRNYD
jgi:hypothetical protein